MNFWLLTNTTYGSWLPGDNRWSYTDVSGTTALTPPQPRLARYAQSVQKGPAIKLSRKQAELVLAQFLETTQYRGWTLPAVAIMYNHFHAVISGPDSTKPDKMLADLKAYATRVLNRRYGKPASETWWTTKGSKRFLPDQEAVDAAVEYVLHKQPNPLVTYPAPAR